MGYRRLPKLPAWLSRFDRALLASSALFLLVLCADLTFHFLPTTPSILWNVGASVVTAITGALISLHRSRDLRKEHKSQSVAWKCIAWSCLLWGAGDVAYAWIDHLTDYAPSPSIADAAYLLAYIPCFAAILLFLSSIQIGSRFRFLLDGVLVASALSVLSWYFIISPLWATSADSFLEKLITVSYPIADTVIQFGTLVLCYSAWSYRTSRSGVVLFALAMGAITIADAGYTFVSLKDAYVDGAWFDFLWPLGYVGSGVAAAMWNGTWKDTSAENRELLSRRLPLASLLSMIAPYVFVASAYGVVVTHEIRTQHSLGWDVLLAGTLLMFVVVFRQILTTVENKKMSLRILEFNGQLEELVTRRTGQLQSLYELAKSVGNSIHMDDICRQALSHATRAIRADAALLFLDSKEEPGSASVGPVVRHTGLDQRGWVLNVITESVGKQQLDQRGKLRNPDDQESISYLCEPVHHKGGGLGSMVVLRWQSEFDLPDSFLLEAIAAEVGTAQENARLYEFARHMADIDALTGLPNHRSAQERLDNYFDYASKSGEQLSLIMVDVNNFKHFNDTYGHIAGDQVLRNVATALRETCRRHDAIARYGGDEFLILMPRTNAVGAQVTAQRIEQRLTEEGFAEPGTDRVIPISVSAGIATFPEDAESRLSLLGIADQRMYDSKRSGKGGTVKRRPQLAVSKSAQSRELGMLESMVNAVDNKDYYTRAHSEEVTEYALWIADQLGFSDEARRTVRTAGLMHDVGKIGIPDEILRKPGHLTDEEFQVMKQHPVVGEMIVASIPGMSDILPGIRSHHERWDGKGYPDGLSGSQIPLLGRLLAVPDALSAMTTDRPYRKGLDWDTAIEEIRRGGGSQFDPDMVEAFLAASARRRHVERRESVGFQKAA